MRASVATYTTLTFDVLAKQNPAMGFLHSYPGTVDTGLLARGVQNWLLWCLVYVVERLMMLRAMTKDDSAERTLDMLLGDRLSNGSWSVDYDGAPGRSQWLQQYREDPTISGKILDFNESMFAKALHT